jgi:trehalose/maltose hydrolase-like predicted phosphorylase
VRAYTEEPATGAPSVREGYLAGVFSDVDAEAARIIGEFPWPVVQMVSLPELFACRVTLGGEVFDPEAGEVLSEARTLDLRTGLYARHIEWRSPRGRTSELVFERFLSAENAHKAGHRVGVTPRGWSGEVELGFPLEGNAESVFRCGNTNEPELPQYHYVDHAVRAQGDAGLVAMTTHHTRHRVALAARIRAPEVTSSAPTETLLHQHAGGSVVDGETLTCERFLAITTSRDELGQQTPEAAAEAYAQDAAGTGFDGELAKSAAVWADRWADADVEIEGPARDQKVVRYNIFQLLQMAPFHTDSISLPARAYAFNRYRGLYFWDTEIFLLPFYIWSMPQVAQNLLTFRYQTLPGARRNAEHWGGEGALYPWMGESDMGTDNSIDARVWKLFHQTADIAYAVDQYARVTGDTAFMAEKGLRILCETARFFTSRLEAGADGLYHLEQTIGPDEDIGPGRDNGFTMLMARRNLQLAAEWTERIRSEAPEAIAALHARMHLGTEEIARWRTVAQKLHVPAVPETEIPLQDEYLLSKKVADVAGWRLREAKENWQVPDGVNLREYQLIKQADIVLAMLLLGDDFSTEQMAAAFDFYEPRTRHISSLSWNTHAIVAARLGRREQAYQYYLKSAGLDLDDIKHATADGLHAAALGGCWQAVVLGFAGLTEADGAPACDPQLPAPWEAVRFTVHCGGTRYRVEARQDGTSSIAPQPKG